MVDYVYSLKDLEDALHNAEKSFKEHADKFKGKFEGTQRWRVMYDHIAALKKEIAAKRAKATDRAQLHRALDADNNLWPKQYEVRLASGVIKKFDTYIQAAPYLKTPGTELVGVYADGSRQRIHVTDRAQLHRALDVVMDQAEAKDALPSMEEAKRLGAPVQRRTKLTAAWTQTHSRRSTAASIE